MSLHLGNRDYAGCSLILVTLMVLLMVFLCGSSDASNIVLIFDEIYAMGITERDVGPVTANEGSMHKLFVRRASSRSTY